MPGLRQSSHPNKEGPPAAFAAGGRSFDGAAAGVRGFAGYRVSLAAGIKFLSSLHRGVHILACMGGNEKPVIDKGAIEMTDRKGIIRSAEPQSQDVDDLIFLGETGPVISQR